MRYRAPAHATLLAVLGAAALAGCSGTDGTTTPGAHRTTDARGPASDAPDATAARPMTAAPSGTPTTGDSPSPPRTSARPAGARWKPRPGLAWQWQLDGKVTPSADVPVYDIDGFENSAADVARLHRDGRKVICYVNVGAWENFRPDKDAFPRSLLGETNGWAGERWLDIRRIYRPEADHGTPLRHVP